MRTPKRASLATVALVTAAATSAIAQPHEDAQRIYRQAVAAFQVRDFTTALARFQRAYVVSRRADLLMNVAVTFERLGRRDDAIATYRSYLASMRDPRNRVEVDATIARLEQESAAERARLAPAPIATPPVIPPVNTAPSPLAVSSAPSREANVAAPSPWPWIMIGGGALLAAGGAVMLALPGDPGSDRSIRTEDAYLRARDQRATLQPVGGVLGGVGLIGLTVGVIGLLTRSPAREPRMTWNLLWRPIDGGGVAEAGRAF